MKWDISVSFAWQKEIISKKHVNYLQLTAREELVKICRFGFHKETQAEWILYSGKMHIMGYKIWQHKDWNIHAYA